MYTSERLAGCQVVIAGKPRSHKEMVIMTKMNIYSEH
jgi:hypothetical protein